MGRRRILIISTAILALAGFIGAVTPFVLSMYPNDEAKRAAKVRIKISDIPSVGALEADYQWGKALFVRYPKQQVFLMPYYDGAYQLPDPTWERAIVPCEVFIISADGFSCKDPSLHGSWHQQARWDLTGKNLGTWMPDLQTIKFRIDDDYIVISPEYN